MGASVCAQPRPRGEDEEVERQELHKHVEKLRAEVEAFQRRHEHQRVQLDAARHAISLQSTLGSARHSSGLPQWLRASLMVASIVFALIVTLRLRRGVISGNITTFWAGLNAVVDILELLCAEVVYLARHAGAASVAVGVGSCTWRMLQGLQRRSETEREPPLAKREGSRNCEVIASFMEAAREVTTPSTLAEEPTRFLSAGDAQQANAIWMNTALEAMWPMIATYVEKVLFTTVEPAIQKAVPTIFKGIHFTELKMGVAPLRFENINVVKLSRESASGKLAGLQLEFDLAYKGDASVIISVMGVSVGASDIRVRGPMVLEIPELVPYPPFFSGCSLYFANSPEIQVDWHGVTDIADWNYLRRKLRNVIQGVVQERIVLPKRVSWVLDRSGAHDIFRVKCPRPEGLLQVTVEQACDLKAADSSILSRGECVSSDPYVVLLLGSQVFRTATVQENLNPVWRGQTKDFLVHFSEMQKVMVSVYDEDAIKYPDFLGEGSVSAAELKDHGDVWVALEEEGGTVDGRRPRVRLTARWRPLLLESFECYRHSGVSVLRQEPCAVLFVGIYSATGLEENAFHWCELEVEGQRATTFRDELKPSEKTELDAKCKPLPSQRTALASPTAPLEVVWEQGFEFLIKDLEAAKLRLRVHTSIGEHKEPKTLPQLKDLQTSCYELSELLRTPKCTEVLHLIPDCGGTPETIVTARMQLRFLGPWSDEDAVALPRAVERRGLRGSVRFSFS